MNWLFGPKDNMPWTPPQIMEGPHGGGGPSLSEQWHDADWRERLSMVGTGLTLVVIFAGFIWLVSWIAPPGK